MTYPAAIGMTKIGGPYMFEYQAPDPAYSGVSGLVVIAESHIAIHTFPELDYFTMDIFSCKNFDHEKAIEYIRNAFDVKEMDRMLVQRGLSFKGPHHGKHGATDELIAAGAGAPGGGHHQQRDCLACRPARLACACRRPARRQHGGGHHERCDRRSHDLAAVRRHPRCRPVGADATQAETEHEAHLSARIVPLDGAAHAPADSLGQPLAATESLHVNPTASISGLLDKMGSLGAGGRALSRSVAEWERLARDPDCAIWLALSTPVVADGLRELLVYAVEHRFVDGIVLTGEDVFADVYESLGHHYYVDEAGVVATEVGRAATEDLLTRWADELVRHTEHGVRSGHDLLHALGELLATRAPRKGVLQAAATSGVRVYAPDLSSSPVVTALRAAQADGAPHSLDPIGDLSALASDLSVLPRFGLIAVGNGTCHAQVLLAGDASAHASTLAGTIALGDISTASPAGDGVGSVRPDARPAVARHRAGPAHPRHTRAA